MIFLGIDPGLAALGWGVVDGNGARVIYVAHGSITTQAGAPLAERLAFIRDELHTVLADYKPREAAMESLFFSRNVTSALPVAEVRGVVRLLCRDDGVPMQEYSPNDIKKAATGSARSGKEDVQKFVKLLLGLSLIPKPNHAADALAVALCHSMLRAAGVPAY